MKHFSCFCGRKKWVDNKIKRVICPSCQVAMRDDSIRVSGDDGGEE